MTVPMTKLCDSIDTLAMAYLDDELADAELRDLELHLLDCGACRALVDTERQVMDGLRRQLVAFVQGLRGIELKKLPSVSETIDWARTLVLLHAEELSHELVRGTLNVLLKFENDIKAVEPQLPNLVHKAKQDAEVLGLGAG